MEKQNEKPCANCKFRTSTTKIQNLYWDVSGVGTSISAQAGKDI